jgi:hypothetical protein
MADGGFQMPTLANLAAVPRWVAWQIEDRQGKPTKMPYRADGRRARANTPATWCVRSAATERAPLLPRPYGKGGIGIMLGEHHGLTIGGLDLDTCISETGDLAPWAVKMMQRFPSYAETSPSGTGLKVFFTYNGADLLALRAVMGTADWSKLYKRRRGGDHPPSIELHLGNRFFTVTDQHYGDTVHLQHVATETLFWLIQEAGPAFAQKEKKERRKAQPRRGRGAASSRPPTTAAGAALPSASHVVLCATAALTPTCSPRLVPIRRPPHGWPRRACPTASARRSALG